MATYTRYDFLTCLMAGAELEGYGVHYGRLVANTTEYERRLIADRGRAHLERRDAVRKRAAEKRTPVPKGTGRYV